LSEFDVLGIQRDQPITEQQITTALDSAKRIKLPRGSAVLLIQSGAMIPDDPMQTELNKSFSVVPFGGIPNKDTGSSYDKALRLAAANGGCPYIICYWGVLEAAQTTAAGKTISWVPIIGGAFPDQVQRMRIRLKVAVIDVRTGQWSLFMPAGYEDTALSSKFRREITDQAQVHKLKEQAYLAAAAELLKIYAN
jgi:hypothetical protein